MVKTRGTTWHRADGALVGAAFVVIFGATSAFAINHYTEGFKTLPEAVEPVIVAESPGELAGARFAADTECLAEAMYYEARGEGVEGEKAVAEVVFQRTRNRNYPSTICGVVHEGAGNGRRTGCQFTFACDGSIDRPRDPQAWAHVRLLAEKIITGQVRLGSETGNAIAYHSVNVYPAWAGSMLRTRQIGNHIFYRFLPRDALTQPAGEVRPADGRSQEIQS